MLYPEADLFHEQLQISVVHSGTNRLLLKGVLLLSGLIPGHHYSLAVTLSEASLLYITVHLGLGEPWSCLISCCLELAGASNL